MRGVNKLTILGNLGADPELRYFPDGTPVAKISLAVSEQWKDKKTNEQRERTDWFAVLFTHHLAKIVHDKLKKGDTILVWGKMKSRSYPDSKTGLPREVWEVHADEMHIVKTKNRDAQADEGNPFDDDDYTPPDSAEAIDQSDHQYL